MEVNYIYQKYEKAHDYMLKKGLISKTDRNWDMYIGNQWKGMKTNGQTLPLLNLIKPIIKYKASTIAQNSMVANYSDAASREEYQPVYQELNQRFSQSWEKAKMDAVSWKMVKNGAIQGDSYVYFWSSDTNKIPQILPNTTVLLGDENEQDIQKQPYIILLSRMDIGKVREVALENHVPAEEVEMIATDDDTQEQIVNKDEVSDKVTVYKYFEKKDGVVYMAQATKTCVFQPLAPFITTQKGKTIASLKLYPIAPFVWEPKPNSARGISEVETLIPNQIELNKTLARRAVTVKLAAFPRLAYDVTAVENPEDLEKVGAPIGVTTGYAQSINQAIAYLNAANISGDADKLFQDLLVQTKDLNGAGDNALGNVNPERASGQAIIAVRDQTQVPLNEQIATYHQYVEDVALIWFDIWSTYDVESFKAVAKDENGNPVLDENGNAVLIQIPTDELDALEPSVRVDISQDNKWTKLAEQQTEDQLLEKGHISFEEWVNLMPDNGSIPKGKLVKLLGDRLQNPMLDPKVQAQQNQMNQQMMAQQMAQGAQPPMPPEMPPEEVEETE